MWHVKKNCENCEFRVQQFDISGHEENMCIINNKSVGLIETCNNFKIKTGEHITKD